MERTDDALEHAKDVTKNDSDKGWDGEKDENDQGIDGDGIPNEQEEKGRNCSCYYGDIE